VPTESVVYGRQHAATTSGNCQRTANQQSSRTIDTVLKVRHRCAVCFSISRENRHNLPDVHRVGRLSRPTSVAEPSFRPRGPKSTLATV
jgi:hypothetical protein